MLLHRGRLTPGASPGTPGFLTLSTPDLRPVTPDLRPVTPDLRPGLVVTPGTDPGRQPTDPSN